MFAVDRLWVEADVVDLCPPRPARIKDYNGRSRRAGYRRDAHRTRTGESLHRCAVSTAILVSWLLSPTHCRASGAERADRIRSRGGSTQPRQYRRTRYFGRNELSRLCLAVLRTAAGTLLSADDIAGAPSTWAPRRLARARLDWNDDTRTRPLHRLSVPSRDHQLYRLAVFPASRSVCARSGCRRNDREPPSCRGSADRGRTCSPSVRGPSSRGPQPAPPALPRSPPAHPSRAAPAPWTSAAAAWGADQFSRLGAHRSAGPALRNSRAPATHSIVWSARPGIRGGIVKPTVTNPTSLFRFARFE